jgi:hypothetical protein
VNLLDEPIQTRTLSATVLALEKAYRAALFGELPNMALIDGTTPDQFRQFVDDICGYWPILHGDSHHLQPPPYQCTRHQEKNRPY